MRALLNDSADRNIFPLTRRRTLRTPLRSAAERVTAALLLLLLLLLRVMSFPAWSTCFRGTLKFVDGEMLRVAPQTNAIQCKEVLTLSDENRSGLNRHIAHASSHCSARLSVSGQYVLATYVRPKATEVKAASGTFLTCDDDVDDGVQIHCKILHVVLFLFDSWKSTTKCFICTFINITIL